MANAFDEFDIHAKASIEEGDLHRSDPEEDFGLKDEPIVAPS